MKNFVTSLFIVVVCLSCGPEDATPDAPIVDGFDPSTATLVRTGMLEGAAGHTAAGTVSIYHSNGSHTIVFDPFESQNGPDLKVYLSKSIDASEYVNLGQLKSTMGKQSYDVPAGVNVASYPFVLIWCEKFTVIFARSEPK
jgi:hypothetical protein